MRLPSVLLLAAAMLPIGCAKDVKPTNPTLTGWERAKSFNQSRPSGARYSGKPFTNVPALPVMPFGVAYDVELVMKSKNKDWDLHEFGRIQTPGGTMWVVNESRGGSTTMHAQVTEVDTLMPEIPVERISGAIEVEDRSNSEDIDITLSYTNADGQPVTAVFLGDGPGYLQKRRNAPVHNGEGIVLTGIDQPYRESAFKSTLEIDGETYRAQKSGMLPFQFITGQVHGGLATGSFYQEATGVVSIAPGAGTVRVVSDEQLAAEAAAVEAEPELTPQQQLMADNQEAIDTCVADAQGDAETGPEGTINIKWTVEVGEVISAELDEGSTLENEGLSTCLLEALQTWEQDDFLEGDNTYSFSFGADEEMAEEGEGDEAEAAEDAEDAGDEEASEEEDGTSVGGTRPEGDEAMEEGEELPEGDELLGDEDPDAEMMEEETTEPGSPFDVSTFRTIHEMVSGQKVAQDWTIDRVGDRVFVRQTSDLRTLEYEFLVFGDLLELTSVQTTQWGRSAPTTRISFSPALPDLRRNFGGTASSDFVVDINGQESAFHGTATASWKGDTVRLALNPEEPTWAAERPMVTTMNFRDGTTNVLVERKGGE